MQSNVSSSNGIASLLNFGAARRVFRSKAVEAEISFASAAFHALVSFILFRRRHSSRPLVSLHFPRCHCQDCFVLYCIAGLTQMRFVILFSLSFPVHFYRFFYFLWFLIVLDVKWRRLVTKKWIHSRNYSSFCKALFRAWLFSLEFTLYVERLKWKCI